MTRGTGKTTAQMKALKQNGVFVWCNDKLDYPKHLAQFHNRPDIVIVGPDWIVSDRWQGIELSDFVIDHAFRSTNSWMVISNINVRIPYIKARVRNDK